MKFIRQLFGKKEIAPLTTAEQIQSLQDQPVNTLEAVVLGTSGEADNTDVRINALQRLTWGGLITDIASEKQQVPAVLVREARKKIAAWLDDHSLKYSDLAEALTDSQLLLSIVGYCSDEQYQGKVLASITDEKALVDVCLKAGAANVRKTIAERIQEPEHLKELAKQLKHKDKNAYKIVKAKVDVIRQKEEAERELQETQAALCVEIEQHAKRGVDHDYQLRLERLERRWAEQEGNISDELAQRFQLSQDVCRSALAARAETLATEVAYQANVSKADQNRQEIIDSLWQGINALYAGGVLSDTDEQSLSDQLAAHKAHWDELKEFGVPHGQHAKLYTQLCDTYAAVMSDIKTGGSFSEALQRLQSGDQAEASVEQEPLASENAPDAEKAEAAPEGESTEGGAVEAKSAEAVSEKDSTEKDSTEAGNKNDDVKPAAKKPADNSEPYLRKMLKHLRGFGSLEESEQLIEARSLLKSLEAVRQEQRDAHLKQIRMTGGLIKKARGAVRDGRLKQAVGMRHSIDEKVAALKDVPQNISSQLEEFHEELQKLVDWQSYAVVPKKNELIEKMEALIGADQPADALANKVRLLQDEWKGLRQSGDERNEDLWEKFKKAADKAYEPCKKHFGELSKERKENLGKRKALVKQLEDYDAQNDWENAEWKTVETILRSARQELHSYSPVDRGANKTVSDAFDAAMNALQARLEGEYSTNKAAKERIIQQAENLATIKDLDQGIESAKRLQAQWKGIGRCSYKENEALWKTFRAHCDVVFNKKGEAVAQSRAEQDANFGSAQELINKIKAINALSGEAFLTSRSEIDSIKEAFYALGDLPSNKERSLQRQLSDSIDAFENKVAGELRKATATTWDQLYEACQRVNHYQAAVHASSEDAQAEVRTELDSFIAGVARWPEGGRSAITSKLANANSAEQNLDGNEKALRLLCVRAEIAADMESPASEKSLRMEYQVGLLQQGVGKQRDLTGQGLALAKEWAGTNMVAEAAYETLFKRFSTAWEKLSV
ncbi:MAG: hypothetical protein COA42_11320 [Alteromonadaceae bacterium]|nr:MAG: hypothetical protein COA42_11320 [Alteromonadaceae bacterium]